MNRYKKSKNPFSGGTEDYCSGNGSIMRLAPVPIRFAFSDPERGLEESSNSSKLTHAGKYAIDCSVLQAGIIISFLRKELTKEQLFSKEPNYLRSLIAKHSLDAKVMELIDSDYATLTENDVQGTAFAVNSLQAALWAFYHTSSFSEGALKVGKLETIDYHK